MKSRLAIFDFDNTLIDFQSADRFVDFVYKRNKTLRGRFITILHPVLRKLKLLTGSRNKKWILKKLFGVHIDILETLSKEYYDLEIKSNFNNQVVEKLIEHKKKDNFIILISGSYDIYLKHFCDELKIDCLISTKILIDKKICQGKIDGIDCMGLNKLIMLNDFLEKNNFDMSNSSFYTDHHSDIYIYPLIKNFILIDYGQNNDWAKNINHKKIKIL